MEEREEKGGGKGRKGEREGKHVKLGESDMEIKDDKLFPKVEMLNKQKNL